MDRVVDSLSMSPYGRIKYVFIWTDEIDEVEVLHTEGTLLITILYLQLYFTIRRHRIYIQESMLTFRTAVLAGLCTGTACVW